MGGNPPRGSGIFEGEMASSHHCNLLMSPNQHSVPGSISPVRFRDQSSFPLSVDPKSVAVCLGGTARKSLLITCGEGVEDILICFMDFSSPISDLCKNSCSLSRASEQTPCSLF